MADLLRVAITSLLLPARSAIIGPPDERLVTPKLYASAVNPLIAAPPVPFWFGVVGLEEVAKLESFECREPLVLELVPQAVPLVDHLDHDDWVRHEELLDQARGFHLRVRHQKHNHDFDFINEWEEVEQLSDVVED
eukprot:CAMPEP_0185585142 /NCGR_PEP_ID=MMETSP0434-20130131/36731_1 /TAXON_ID=626734 ORGANISM="Favella taraikaensis, Strain Fe Narragansett Bay" /NCGR_SAMPLE_ID=MMETSP0434 /ASSEMBLY_ACC=CAM_ASM_000379 /LENGTH=135 /DNA_ID=CAMNT_0028205293 /DNA_START=103 /DNA_END=509 /DNA_ORIENTATION=-